MKKVYYCNKLHLGFTMTEGSLKQRPLLFFFSSLISLSPPHSCALRPSRPLYNMPPGDIEKPSSELEVQEHALALNTMPDAEMTSADHTEMMPMEIKLCTQTDPTSVTGDACLLLQGQLDSITESVWLRIGQRLDAKRSRDSTEREDAIEELFKLQAKFSDLSDKHKANMAKLVSLKRE